MESMHMTQQVFADFIGIAPATLSGIFNDRTRPTINIVEAIKKKIPNINTDWLMFNAEPMYIDELPRTVESSSDLQGSLFDIEQSQGASSSPTPLSASRMGGFNMGVRTTPSELDKDSMKNIDKMPRRVTEIRIFYDDQTWESFVPSKK